ncbi:hypothetical protein I552_3314 [Mycobacterium xenopi 3993]|nr:hypothetical protein I552_3314 [Mycobacterium xenopi 3993]
MEAGGAASAGPEPRSGSTAPHSGLLITRTGRVGPGRDHRRLLTHRRSWVQQRRNERAQLGQRCTLVRAARPAPGRRADDRRGRWRRWGDGGGSTLASGALQGSAAAGAQGRWRR